MDNNEEQVSDSSSDEEIEFPWCMATMKNNETMTNDQKNKAEVGACYGGGGRRVGHSLNGQVAFEWQEPDFYIGQEDEVTADGVSNGPIFAPRVVLMQQLRRNETVNENPPAPDSTSSDSSPKEDIDKETHVGLHDEDKDGGDSVAPTFIAADEKKKSKPKIDPITNSDHLCAAEMGLVSEVDVKSDKDGPTVKMASEEREKTDKEVKAKNDDVISFSGKTDFEWAEGDDSDDD